MNPTEPTLFQPYSDKVNTILMRHGRALSNVDDSLFKYGYDNLFGLTLTGVHQVESSAGILKRHLWRSGVDTVWLYVSDTVRAKQTASIVKHIFSRPSSSGKVIDVRELVFTAPAEFYNVNDGAEPEAWNFRQYMESPHDWDFGPGVMCPYEHYFLASSSYRHFAEQVMLHAKGAGHKGKPTILWVGHHFLFNMVRLYLASLEADRELGTCLNDYLMAKNPEANSALFLEPRKVPTTEKPLHVTITPRSVAMAFNQWATNDVEVLNYVDAARELLESALHLPMENADFNLNPHEPTMLEFPNLSYMPEGWKNPRGTASFWFDFHTQYAKLKQAYKALTDVPKS